MSFPSQNAKADSTAQMPFINGSSGVTFEYARSQCPSRATPYERGAFHFANIIANILIALSLVKITSSLKSRRNGLCFK